MLPEMLLNETKRFLKTLNIRKYQKMFRIVTFNELCTASRHLLPKDTSQGIESLDIVGYCWLLLGIVRKYSHIWIIHVLRAVRCY